MDAPRPSKKIPSFVYRQDGHELSVMKFGGIITEIPPCVKGGKSVAFSLIPLYNPYKINNMQNRDSCVKCSADGELPRKRKAGLTI